MRMPSLPRDPWKSTEAKNRITLHAMTLRTLLFFLFLSIAGGASASMAADLTPELRDIERKYDFEIATSNLGFPVETKYGLIDGKKAEPGTFMEYARIFAPEFALYPPELVQRTRLKRVVLCTELTFAGQRRNAVPDFEHDTLYLDIARGTHNQDYLRKVIHHEFFHIIDFRDDGSVYRDDHWAAHNPPGFEYGNGGRNAQNRSETSLLTHKFPGFLNHYSTTGVEEDKAEIFANLIVDFDHVEARSKSDMVIDKKCEAMRELLSKFSPAMDESFWRKARELRRTGR